MLAVALARQCICEGELPDDGHEDVPYEVCTAYEAMALHSRGPWLRYVLSACVDK